MVDPNSKTSMYESDAIIDYLFETYGEGAKVRQMPHTFVGARCVSTQLFQWKYCSVGMIEHWCANKMTSIFQLSMTGFCNCHAAVCYQVGAVWSSMAVAGSVGFGYSASWHVWVSTRLLPHMKPQRNMY